MRFDFPILLTVVGLLVYSLIQRQVRWYLQQHHESIPGNKGETTEPKAAVVFESFTSVILIHLDHDGVDVCQVHGWQGHHQLICQALGVDCSWHEGAANQKINPMRLRAP